MTANESSFWGSSRSILAKQKRRLLYEKGHQSQKDNLLGFSLILAPIFLLVVFAYNAWPEEPIQFDSAGGGSGHSVKYNQHHIAHPPAMPGQRQPNEPHLNRPSKELLSKFDFLQAKDWNTDLLPLIDKADYVPTNDIQANWTKYGFHIESGAIPDDLIDKYKEDWIKYNPPNSLPNGLVFPIQYMYAKANRDILCHENVQRIISDLIGEPMALHLSLTGWLSTQRDWHQDGYLNPDSVHDHYIAVWIALEDIHPDSGPFQFIPGSHRWGFHITQNELKKHLTAEEANSEGWPTYSERILTPLFEEVIEKSGVQVQTHLPKKGDLLVWHARLAHRGSKAKVPGTPRRSLIGHFSGIHHRSDMPEAVPYGGGYLFPLGIHVSKADKKLVETFEAIYQPPSYK